MKKKTDMTTIWVSKDQRDSIQKLKKHPNQPDHEIIDVLLEAYEQVHAQVALKGGHIDG